MSDTATAAAKPVAAKPAAKPVVKPAPKAATSKPSATKVAAKAAQPKAVAKKKPASTVKSKPTAAKTKPAAVAKPAKTPKNKLVRDSFTFPESEFQTLVALKKRLLAAGTEVKKGELVRAGLALLNTLGDAALAAAVAKVEKLKTGRPAK